jgi:phosphate transport system permease protein
MTAARQKERIGKAVFAAAAVICVIAVVAIFAFLIYKSIPAFGKLGVFRFMFGDNWSPDRLDTYDSPLSGTYGILTMIVGTLAATAGALLVGGVLGYFTAVFLAFYCPRVPRRILSSVINLLAGIPSVVYGFFGIVFLLPLLARIAPNNGSGLLATSLILGIMILPTVVSLSRTSLEAVPHTYYEGSVAMGATHSETVFRIMSPAARSGITASLILGVGRALGETMAVVMVAGNSPTYPDGLFSSFRVLTANIVMEMGYAGEVQEGALVATGVVLLLFVLAVNLVFGALSTRAVKKMSSRQTHGRHKSGESRLRAASARVSRRVRDWAGSLGGRIRICRIGQIVSVLSGVAVAAVLVLIIGFILVKGLPYLVRNPSLIWGEYEFGGEKVTILPAIITTLYAVGLSLLIAVPIGIMTAVFLNEYARRSNPFVRLIRSAIDILSGVPSIVYGLFGMITFVKLFGGSSSILAGSLTVSMMLLPTIVRSTEESLKSVSDAMREGSLALGAGKLRTIFKIVLPSALPGILSAVILSMGRVISESAPFLYTMGSVISAVPHSLSDSGASLAVALYQLSGEGWYMNEAYATAVVLIVLVLTLNLLAEFAASRLSRKLKGASK